MNLKNLFGGAIFVAGFVGVFFVTDGAAYYLNPIGLLIVLTGTIGATILSYPFDDLKAALHVGYRSYTVRPPTAFEVIDTLLHLAV
ncbi:MAG: flagellar motor protein MotA, partial [Gemmatimonadota bacterium]|nr:flagellar motor protein MotA [Gemmatimonadota bacterium]